MPRPPMPVGTWGTISVAWSERDGAFKARARYRDADGVVRPVARLAATKGAAERALRAALRDRQRSAGLGITADTRVADLIGEWLTRVDRADLAIGTKQQYAKIARATVTPALGQLRVGEVTVPVADAALQTINVRHGYSVAKTARSVMSGVLGLAVRQGALPANPVRDAERLSRGGRPTKRPRALTVAEETGLLDALHGTPRAVDLDLPGLAEFMLMTGARIGEALACRLDTNSDGLPLLDLDAGTWEINATVIRVGGVRRRAALEAKPDRTADEEQQLALIRAVPPGLYVQEHPKSEAGWRVIALPPAVVDLLRRRLAETRLRPRTFNVVDADGRARTSTATILFPSPAARTLRDPNNAQGDLRETLDRIGCPACDNTGKKIDRDSGEFVVNGKGRPVRCDQGPWSWITSHAFRKTVATRMEEAGCTPRQVADQLGHSKVSMTQDVYFGRGVVVAEAARILDRSAT
jgi:integrase